MRRFELTATGLETYLRSYEPEYRNIETTVIARLAGWPNDQGSERELTEVVAAPRLIVQHVLDRCAARGLLKMSNRLADLPAPTSSGSRHGSADWPALEEALHASTRPPSCDMRSQPGHNRRAPRRTVGPPGTPPCVSRRSVAIA